MLQLRPGRSENPVLLPSAMVMSGPELQLRAMAGSLVLPLPGSVLMLEVPVTIEGHMDSQDLGPC